MTFHQTIVRWTAAPNKNARPLFDRVLHLIFDFLPLRRGVQRPDDHALFEPVADAKLLHLADQLCDELVVNLVKEIKPLDCQTSLAAIEKSSDRCGADGLVDIRIIANDHRVTASKFQSDAFDVLCRDFHDMFPGGSGSGETDFA